MLEDRLAGHPIMSERSSDLPVRIIRPHEGLDAFKDAIVSSIRDFPKARALAWRMLLRDVRATYRQSLLGYLWMFLPPLATTFIWVFLNQQQLVSIDSGDVPFPIFVLTGNILWAAFNGAVMSMLSIFGASRGMLSKVNFPHESLAMTAWGKSALDGFVPAFLLIPALAYYGVDLAPQMLLFPLGLLGILFIGGAIGLLFVPISALYMDVGRAIQLGLRLGFFLTPVIYPLPSEGWARSLLLWNPVTSPLVTSRTWLVGSGPDLLPQTLAVLSLSVLVTAVALVAFKIAMPHLIERLSS